MCGSFFASKETFSFHWTPVYPSVLEGDGPCVTQTPFCFPYYLGCSHGGWQFMVSHRVGRDLVAEQQHHLDSWDTVKAGASLAYWPLPLWTPPMSWVSPDASLGVWRGPSHHNCHHGPESLAPGQTERQAEVQVEKGWCWLDPSEPSPSPARTSLRGGGSKRPLGCAFFGDCLLFHFLAFLPSALWPPERPGRFS